MSSIRATSSPMSLPRGGKRAQLVDLGFKLGDGFFEVEIAAHRVGINLQYERNGARGEADSANRTEKFCNFNRLTRIRAECAASDRRQVTLFPAETVRKSRRAG